MALNDNLQQQLIKDLLVESFDALDRFDGEMLALEKGKGSAESLNNVFRIIHTIKGSSGCIGLNKIESVAHVGESLLSLLRDGKLVVSPALISGLLEYSDALKGMLRCLEQTGEQGDTDYSSLMEKLRGLQSTDLPAVNAEAAYGLFSEEPSISGLPKNPPGEVHAVSSTRENQVVNADSAAKDPTTVADSAIRVDVTQLDKLMNLVGELVLARNQIVQFTSQAQEPTLLNAAQRLNIITTELQESVMKTRMQPIGNVWAKFPRIVRDLAHELGKRVQLVMEGNETELDRTIIEAIKDPLTHIIRNSVDHGIELPEKRQASGKAEQGKVILRAFHEGGQVNIEIIDDGRGIDMARVKEKAM
ncbi:MAG TPA: Hpt domain-containing protein, partial [Terriglobales bacterium]|nr:Hpt domain-containing protein [Terriglobales bacterium]